MITYNFPNLPAVADHLLRQATQLRNEADRIHATKGISWRLVYTRLMTEAAAFERAAGIVRNTKIEERTQ